MLALTRRAGGINALIFINWIIICNLDGFFRNYCEIRRRAKDLGRRRRKGLKSSSGARSANYICLNVLGILLLLFENIAMLILS